MGATLQQDRCTQNDYVRLFAGSAEPLRWLCFTLTGDEDLSERVLNAALEQCLKGAERVFRDWMVGWARRLIVKACIATARPTAYTLEDCLCPLHQEVCEAAMSDQLELALSQPPDVLQRKLLQLDSLSRFVFVLRAVEGYSRRDTALLLDIGDRTCESLYTRTLQAVQAHVYVMKPTSAGLKLVAI